MNNAQEAAGTIAKAMLDGSMHYLEGAIQLVSLREALGSYENDPDFMPFIAVLAEIDDLGIQRHYESWDANIAHLSGATLDESVDWAKSISIEQCQSLAKRYLK